MPETEPPKLSDAEAALLLSAMRAELPSEELDFYLGLPQASQGPTPFGAPDNVRYIYALHGAEAKLPRWFAVKYADFIGAAADED